MRNYKGTRVMVTPSVLYSDEAAIAAIDGSEGGFLRVFKDGMTWDDGDRVVFAWAVYNSDGELIDKGDDIRGPVWSTALSGMSSLVSFLSACAESESEESENYSLFIPAVREWAELYSDELSIIGAEIAEELGES